MLRLFFIFTTVLSLVGFAYVFTEPGDQLLLSLLSGVLLGLPLGNIVGNWIWQKFYEEKRPAVR